MPVVLPQKRNGFPPIQPYFPETKGEISRISWLFPTFLLLCEFIDNFNSWGKSLVRI